MRESNGLHPRAKSIHHHNYHDIWTQWASVSHQDTHTHTHSVSLGGRGVDLREKRVFFVAPHSHLHVIHHPPFLAPCCSIFLKLLGDLSQESPLICACVVPKGFDDEERERISILLWMVKGRRDNREILAHEREAE